MAALTCASAGAHGKLAQAAASSSAGTQRGSPAMSPHRLTLMPLRAADAPRLARSARSTAGCSGSIKVATERPFARRGHDILGQIVRADREEGGLESADRRNRRRRHLDHDAERRASRAMPSPASSATSSSNS